jgi:hypothetical protein
MITLTLTAEYDPESDQWEVLLPNGIEHHKLVFKQSLIETPEDIEPTWTDEEITAMFEQPEQRMSGAELVAWLQTEGGWEDMGITDSAQWSIAQRRQEEERVMERL